MQLRDSQGFLLSDAEEARCIKMHMEKLYVDRNATPLHGQVCNQLPFDEASLFDSLMRIPARKASPPGLCKGAFLKHSAAVLAPVLLSRLKLAWEGHTGAIASSWRMSWLCWLPKPQKSQADMLGWRGISLQSVIGKAVLRCIERSIRSRCAHTLASAPQYAYSKGRGTGDAIARAVVHQSLALSKGQATQRTIHDRKAGIKKSLLGGGLQA